MSLPIEQLGPYKLQRLLGRGGMGAVYAGVNEQTGEQAAIKVLSPSLADDAGFRERFKAEIETLEKLRHPNIVELFGYGEEAGHLFYAMELVDGRTLQDELQTGKRFDWREAGRIGIEICQGLKHAHDVGVIHRDLKPANLLITPAGQIKLSDFGIAKLYGTNQLTSDGGVLGTADYMAPEQAEGRPVTARCDLYSLGSVLFALLARRPPFTGSSMAQVLHALKFDHPPSVLRFAPQTPPEFDDILQQLLAKDPTQRIATALAVSNRLKATLHGLSQESAAAQEGGDEEPARVVTPDRLTRISDRTTQAPAAAADSPSPSVTCDIAFLSETTPAEPAATPTEAPRHFTLVDKTAAAKRGAREGEEGISPWIVATLAIAVLAIIGGSVWLLTRPPSATALYERIMGAAETGEPASLLTAETQVEFFLEKYPNDPRAAEVAALQQEMELFRLQRRLELRARRAGGSEVLLPVVQAYLEAIALERTNPEEAIRRLEALIAVFGNDPTANEDAQRSVELARRQLTVLRERVSRSHSEYQKRLSERLAHAQQMAGDDPQGAATICRGIIALYGDKPWAATIVRQARELLSTLP